MVPPADTFDKFFWPEAEYDIFQIFKIIFRRNPLNPMRSKRPVPERDILAFSPDFKQQVQNAIVRHPDALDPASQEF